MQPLTIFALVVCAYALWVRRSTWATRWDGAVTLGLALRTVGFGALLPATGRVFGPPLHRVTGVWNVEELSGHILYLGALMSVVYMALSRLRLGYRQRRRMLRRHLELPAVFTIAVGVLLFVYGAPDENIPSMVNARPTVAMCAYGGLTIGAVMYFSVVAIWALRIIGRNPASRTTARVYIGVSCTAMAVCLVGVAEVVLSAPHITWVAVRVELMVYAGAAIYSWKHRQFAPEGKKPQMI